MLVTRICCERFLLKFFVKCGRSWSRSRWRFFLFILLRSIYDISNDTDPISFQLKFFPKNERKIESDWSIFIFYTYTCMCTYLLLLSFLVLLKNSWRFLVKLSIEFLFTTDEIRHDSVRNSLWDMSSFVDILTDSCRDQWTPTHQPNNTAGLSDGIRAKETEQGQEKERNDSHSEVAQAKDVKQEIGTCIVFLWSI